MGLPGVGVGVLVGVAVEVGAVSICTFVLVSKYFCTRDSGDCSAGGHGTRRGGGQRLVRRLRGLVCSIEV